MQYIGKDQKDVELIKNLFVARFDAFVKQTQSNGTSSYVKVDRLFTDTDMQDHLSGRHTYGTYVVSKEGECKSSEFDIDIPKNINIDEEAWKEVKNKVAGLMITLIESGVDPNQILIEHSGRRGFHVWVLFEEAIPSWQAYSFAKLILAKSKVVCESFPKQYLIGDGYGSAIKLPLGIHLATGQRSHFVDEEFNPIQDQFEYLRKVERLPVSFVQDILLKNGIPLEFETNGLEVSGDMDFDWSKKGGSLEALINNCRALQEIIKKATETGHLTHDERLFLVNILALFGEEGERKIHEIISHCSDYDSIRTQNGINYRKEKKYKPMTCQWPKDKGLCSYSCNLKPKSGQNASPIQLCFKTQIQDGVFEITSDNQNCLTLKSVDGLTFKLSDFESNKYGVWTRIELSGKKGRIYTDRLMISSSKSRKQFIKRCFEFGGEEELSSIAMEMCLMSIDQLLRDKIAEENKHSKLKKPKYEMTPEEIEEAMAFAADPELINNIKHDLSQLGHVGEDANKFLLYIACTSRKGKKPLACVIKGQSSSGKNVLVLTVLDLMPEEEKKVISQLTPKALFYLTQDSLPHSILCIAEKVGSEQADYSVRSMISEGNLTSLAVVKNEQTGQLETQEIVVAGPIVYIETTTQLTINDENATRLISIYLDDSEMQTSRIHAAQRQSKTLDGLAEEENIGKIKRKHKNFQRLLRILNVVIPYANLLIFPTGSIRTRRDNDKFLTLIIAIVLLRQFQKEVKYKNNIAYIEADLKDYQLAYELSQTVLNQTLDEVSVKSRELMEIINNMVLGWHGDGGRELELYNKDVGRILTNIVFTRADVRNCANNWSDSLLHACMRELGYHDLLRVIQGGQGKSYKYTLLDCNQSANHGVNKLLTTEELKAKIDSQTLQ